MEAAREAPLLSTCFKLQPFKLVRTMHAKANMLVIQADILS